LETSGIRAREAQRLFQIGIGLFLFSVLIGFAIPRFTVPRVALSAHLIGMLQGMFLTIIGLLWSRLSLRPGQSKIAFWLMVYQAVTATLSNLLAAAWGAGHTMIPMAAGAARGGNTQEIIISIGLRSTALCLILALLLILWGLRRSPA
jgi:(hydroxyamino)benzene mutase